LIKEDSWQKIYHFREKSLRVKKECVEQELLKVGELEFIIVIYLLRTCVSRSSTSKDNHFEGSKGREFETYEARRVKLIVVVDQETSPEVTRSTVVLNCGDRK
jgi:hypothetical protein